MSVVISDVIIIQVIAIYLLLFRRLLETQSNVFFFALLYMKLNMHACVHAVTKKGCCNINEIIHFISHSYRQSKFSTVIVRRRNGVLFK